MKLLKWIIIFFYLLTSPSIDAGWEFVSPMPKPRYGHDATLGPDGNIYVMGGFVWYMRLGNYSNLVYKIREDKWVFLEPVPGYETSESLFSIYDSGLEKWRSVRKIKGSDNKYEIRNPNGKGWIEVNEYIPPEKLRKTNFDRQGDGPAIVSGKDGLIYWTGGSGMPGGSGENVVFVFDPEKGTWPLNVLGYSEYDTGVPCMLERRIDHEAVVTSDGKIYAIGGTDKGAYDNKTKLNKLLPAKLEFYTGKVQDTVEVLDIFEQ